MARDDHSPAALEPASALHFLLMLWDTGETRSHKNLHGDFESCEQGATQHTGTGVDQTHHSLNPKPAVKQSPIHMHA